MKIETFFDSALNDGVTGLFDADTVQIAANAGGWNIWVDRHGVLIIKREDEILLLSENE